MEKSPYVISEELDMTTKDYTPIINRSQLDAFREGLDADLRSMGKQTCWVSSGDITTSLKRATDTTRLPIVSLDDRYASNANQYLGISRGVDINLNDEGYVARYNYPPIEQQLKQIAALGREVVLVDDVLFSGEMVSWLGERLAQSGVKLGAVAVGIAMQEGITKLAEQGIAVDAGIVFESVEDELCERDLVTVPGSGRRVTSANANALYFDIDNGNPERWASIDSSVAAAFCASSLERSLRLLRPNIPMSSLGAFIGYDTAGDATTVLTKRLGEL